MAYLLIIREPRGQRAKRSEEQGKQVYDEMLKFGEGLAKRGLLVAAESLRDDSHGVRVSLRDGKTNLMDGPFTESKEMIGGFFLIEVDQREEAIEIARQCPAAAFATLEVRELAPCYTR
ncbi:MAG: YciI family protein [Candidatus Thiodiazotropha sp.]